MTRVLAAALFLFALQSPGYVPERVFDTRQQAFVDFEVMLAGISEVDVVFVGEMHDDPNTHLLEAAILDGLQRRKRSPVVSLEMFERDAQGAIDGYLAGRIGEEEMLKGARPWPRYATDYRLLVERAKEARWPVIAANVPRSIAQKVAKGGKDAIAQLTEAERANTARDLECPLDAYFDRFAQSMGAHPAPNQSADETKAMAERYYWSQCVKDETMAEAIAAAVQTGPARSERSESKGPVVHYNGAFHSDFGLGTAERVRRRLPGKRTVVISMLPVEDLDKVQPAGEDLKRADYLVYTYRVKPQPAEKK
ncbi:MAG TPA: ChaN family lipoprotein [Vicinamibacterales bacterium]|nr:ChaN family lipoprotein [Vicinamibacterales bacterium]